MLIILSPSKTMDFKPHAIPVGSEQPLFISKASQLVTHLQSMSASEIRQLMDISGPLAAQTKTRFMEWSSTHTTSNSKASLFAFSGDVYDGLQAKTFNQDDIKFAQKHLIILSGLYGLLRPLDHMQAFRLEMGIKWETDEFKNLYQYWTDSVNSYISASQKKLNNTTIINLASQEYFKIIDERALNMKIISPVFAEYSEGKMRTVSIYAKKARGLMARFIIRNRIINSEEMITFNEDRYSYISELSTETKPVFAR